MTFNAVFLPSSCSSSSSLLQREGGWRRRTCGAQGTAGWPLRGEDITGSNSTGQNRLRRHWWEMWQQRIQQQEETPPDHVHERPARGVRESLPKNALSRCVCEGTAGHAYRAHRGQSAGTALKSHACMPYNLLQKIYTGLRWFYI